MRAASASERLPSADYADYAEAEQNHRGLPAAADKNKLNRAEKFRSCAARNLRWCTNPGKRTMILARRIIERNANLALRRFPANHSWIFVVVLSLVAAGGLRAKTPPGEVGDLTGNYQFLGPFDTLALLQEEGTIKGYIDVMQGQSESDVVLSYPIIIGSRQGNHIEFRTRRIHEKYYRFSGTVERGTGRKASDPDYLQLSGELQIISRDPATDKEVVDRQPVVFKSKGESKEQP
jgi:hypothetical protein